MRGGGVRGLLHLEKIIFKFTQLSITTTRPWTLTPLSIGPPPFGKKTLGSMFMIMIVGGRRPVYLFQTLVCCEKINMISGIKNSHLHIYSDFLLCSKSYRSNVNFQKPNISTNVSFVPIYMIENIE